MTFFDNINEEYVSNFDELLFKKDEVVKYINNFISSV